MVTSMYKEEWNAFLSVECVYLKYVPLLGAELVKQADMLNLRGVQ
jgi:hypothetical protein